MQTILSILAAFFLLGIVLQAVIHIPHAIGYAVRWCVDGYRQGRGQ
jgi:hypothetical protein